MNVHNIGQGEARHKSTSYEDLNTAVNTIQVTCLPLPKTTNTIRFGVLNGSEVTEALHTYTGSFFINVGYR
jgi:hypothetical protein